MLVKVIAAEDIKVGAWVGVITGEDGKLYCRPSPKSPHAMTARNIVKGEVLAFNTAGNTRDLLRRLGGHSSR
jgi:hypothetical protein